jgi:hypothetical protein
MADFRLGRLKFNWRGNWQVATSYEVDDIVKYGANTYVAVSNHTSASNETMFYSADSTNWNLHTESIETKGDWQANYWYKLNDVAKYGNNQYRVTTPHTSQAAFNESNFELFVSGLVFEDTWAIATEYQPGDIVSYGGYTYVATSIHTGSTPNTLVNWEIVTTGFKVVGDWNAGTEYKQGDVVLLGGNSYVAKTTNTGNNPSSNPTDWDFIVGGFTWQGTWNSGTTYYAGDAVVRNSNSYIAVAESTNETPETDANGDYWNTLAEGAQSNVLTTTGDILYRSGAGAARLPIGTDGQVLAVNASGVPVWENNNVTDPVYYVTTEGSDTNTGENISRAFASLRYACDNITGPASIYVKAGTYNETLPIIVPENVSIIGDNLRTSVIKPAVGQNSSMIDVTLDTLVDDDDIVDGETAQGGNATGVIYGHRTAGNVTVLQILPSSGTWSNSSVFPHSGGTAAVTAVAPVINEETTMFFMSNKTMLKDLVMDGMAGFEKSTSDPKDLNTATIKGTFLRLNPNSPTTKSPYISQCSAFSQTGVGAIVDGKVHEKWDGTATPSNKSMLFDSFTQIHEGSGSQSGVGFFITNNGNSEIVSCFTYYAHASYVATRGGSIRSLAGNSSWGTYGIISSGFNADETTLDGRIDGVELNFVEGTNLSPGGSLAPFSNGERVIGAVSGAIAEVLSSQNSANKVLVRKLKGDFTLGETISGNQSLTSATLVSNADFESGQKGFALVVRDLSAAPKPGGSIEFVTGPGNAGADQFTYVVTNSSYTPPDGKGDLVVVRGSLGSTAVTHDGLLDIVRYSVGGSATLQANIDAVTTTITVDTISPFTAGSFLIINNEVMQIDAATPFPSASSINVVRGVETSTASTHAGNDTVRAITGSNPTQTQNIGDLDAVSTNIRVFNEDSIVSGDYVRLDSEFMLVTTSTEDPNGEVLLTLAEEKPTASYDGQTFKIRYLYSQVRLTGHDFLNIGTGGKTTTNFPGLPIQSPAPGNEVTEQLPGRVYYVSTDQDGNFSVGKYFRVNQSTGSTTLNASSFDLSGLSSLQLGSIGAQIGEIISEFSSDGTLSANSNEKVPTEQAVKTYVDTEVKNLKGYVFWAGAI